MNNEFYTILTNAGLAAIANASVSNATLNFSKVAVGDGNGAYYTPTRDMTALRRQTWEGNIASVQVAEDNPNWINVEAVIPATDGGFYIREIGIFNDANVLLAIGKLPETYKPEMESGSTKDLYLKAIFEVTNASVITLKVDPSVVLASKKYVDDKVTVVSTNLTSLSEEFTQHKEDNMHVHWIGTAAGTNALTATYAEITAYSDGLGVSFKNTTDSNAVTSLNVNGLGAIPILKSNGGAVSNLKANGVYTLRYVSGNFILQGEGGEYGTASISDVRSTKTVGTENGVLQGALDLTNLTSTNIKKGVTIDGVSGSLVEGSMSLPNNLDFSLNNRRNYHVDEDGNFYCTELVTAKYAGRKYDKNMTLLSTHTDPSGNARQINSITKYGFITQNGTTYYHYDLAGTLLHTLSILTVSTPFLMPRQNDFGVITNVNHLTKIYDYAVTELYSSVINESYNGQIYLNKKDNLLIYEVVSNTLVNLLIVPISLVAKTIKNIGGMTANVYTLDYTNME